MYLALKEIKHEKLRYGLIIAMIVLISYLIFVLTSLALGLANENTEAIDSWDANSVVLNKDSNISLGQSFISNDEADKIDMTNKDAYLGQASVVAKASGHEQISSSYLGINKSQFIFKGLKLSSGHKATKNFEVVADEQFKNDGYKLGDKVKLNSYVHKFTIVGFTKGAKLNVAPVLYGNMNGWTELKNAGNTFKASAIVSKKNKVNVGDTNLKSYTMKTFINKLPGYSAQNQTFTFMIAFLMIISLIVIAVFLYILTIQKLPNYAVLRAQGIPAKVLVQTTISQSVILVISGLIIGTILTVATALLIPTSVPMNFNFPILSLVAVGLVLTSVLGAIIPVRTILKVDPVTVIGG
ncbi:ABC transporter permease [Companilactobacillus ginsenosidimutans]|uniref:Putative hemin transport system permease protein HrtB n=1 Tax=Companilactobacillus ginsenosidimutans TaxID=1007676 RepID=A0A0H4QMF4_9LACO|nr:ABC transporter permease [Companilactobacillus ginsenosidimutans]AKP68296.1 ABC transporter permease [Companilactobacillus ginsenosidimutans]